MDHIINGNSALIDLKKSLSYLQKVYDDSVIAINGISNSSLTNTEEFVCASNYISSNVLRECESLMDNISNLGKSLVTYINQYNSNVFDENGEKIRFAFATWTGINRISSVNTSKTPTVSRTSSEPKKVEFTELSNYSNSNFSTINPSSEQVIKNQVDGEQIEVLEGKTETPLEAKEDSFSTQTETPLEAKKEVSQDVKKNENSKVFFSKVEYQDISDDDLNSVFNAVMTNGKLSYEGNNVIKYNNKFYLWNDIKNKIISNLNLEGKIDNISVINTTCIITMKSGNTYNNNSISSYSDLVTLLQSLNA